MTSLIIHRSQEAVPVAPRDHLLHDIAVRIRQRIASTTESIVAIGQDLIAAKEHLPHGTFTDWITAEFGFTARTAQNFMAAATFAEGKSEIISHLPPTAVYRLSAKAAPPVAVADILDRVRDGERLTDREVRERLDEARHEERQRQLRSERAQREGRMSRSKRAKLQQARDDAARARCAEHDRIEAAADVLLERLGADGVRVLVDAVGDLDWWHVRDALRQRGGAA